MGATNRCFAVFLALFCGHALSDVYKSTDSSGQTTYSDKPTPGAAPTNTRRSREPRPPARPAAPVDASARIAQLAALIDVRPEAIQPLVAQSPYTVVVGPVTRTVELGGQRRTFELGGGKPFINSATGVTDYATLIAGDPRAGGGATVLSSTRISNAGIPGRIEKQGSRMLTAYVAGDNVSAGNRLRTQVSSFAIPSRKRLVWDLRVIFGGGGGSEDWFLSPPRESPAVVWQIKAPSAQGAVALVVDTDPNNARALQLSLVRKAGTEKRFAILGRVGGLPVGKPIDLVIDVFTDERDRSSGGSGYVRAWIYEDKFADQPGPTLTAGVTEPHQYFLSVYLYDNDSPLPYSKAAFWERGQVYEVKQP